MGVRLLQSPYMRLMRAPLVASRPACKHTFTPLRSRCRAQRRRVPKYLLNDTQRSLSLQYSVLLQMRETRETRARATLFDDCDLYCSIVRLPPPTATPARVESGQL